MSSSTAFPAGAAPAVAKAGDLVLTRDAAPWYTKQGIVGGLIRFGQRLQIIVELILGVIGHPRRVQDALAQYRAKAVYCWCNHAACVTVDGDADHAVIVQMLGHGAETDFLSAYTPRDYVLVSVSDSLTAANVDSAVAFWQWLASTHVGYGYVSIAVIALSMLTGLKIGVAYKDRPVCSAAYAAGVSLHEWRVCPTRVLPCDLAAYWRAGPPT